MSDVVKTQKRNLPLLLTPTDCAGRTYIVTGANTGLGYEAAKHLATLGAARVILAVRSLASGEEAKAKIDASGVASGVVEVWSLDLSSYDSVKGFARRAASELDRIDGLIENAAVATAQRTLAEGHVLCLTVNVFSTFLLAILLMPKMGETAEKFGAVPHIAIVTSRAGFDVKEDWDQIKGDPVAGMNENNAMNMKSYPLSKLIEIMAVRYLAPLIPVSKTGVVMNLVCPGLCVTSLARNAPQAFKDHLRQQHEQYGRTAEDGSRTLLHGAGAGKDSHGKLLHSCEVGESDIPEWVDNDKEAQRRAWECIAKELEAAEPGCVGKIVS